VQRENYGLEVQKGAEELKPPRHIEVKDILNLKEAKPPQEKVKSLEMFSALEESKKREQADFIIRNRFKSESKEARLKMHLRQEELRKQLRGNIKATSTENAD